MTNQNPYPISSLTKEDIPKVMDLYRSAILPVWLESGRDHNMEKVARTMEARLVLPDHSMFVVHDPKTKAVTGYLAWEKHEEHTSNHMIAHLRMILVDPEQQGTGLGRRLMEEFENSAKADNCTKILFDVVTGSPARQFYESLGFWHWSDYMEKKL